MAVTAFWNYDTDPQDHASRSLVVGERGSRWEDIVRAQHWVGATARVERPGGGWCPLAPDDVVPPRAYLRVCMGVRYRHFSERAHRTRTVNACGPWPVVRYEIEAAEQMHDGRSMVAGFCEYTKGVLTPLLETDTLGAGDLVIIKRHPRPRGQTAHVPDCVLFRLPEGATEAERLKVVQAQAAFTVADEATRARLRKDFIREHHGWFAARGWVHEEHASDHVRQQDVHHAEPLPEGHRCRNCWATDHWATQCPHARDKRFRPIPERNYPHGVVRRLLREPCNREEVLWAPFYIAETDTLLMYIK